MGIRKCVHCGNEDYCPSDICLLCAIKNKSKEKREAKEKNDG